MAKVVSFPNSVNKHGFRRVRRRKRIDLEKFGQLNMFGQVREARIVRLNAVANPFERALELEESNDLESAIPMYEEAAKRSAYAGDAYCNLGIIKSQQEKHVEAIDYFTRALAHNSRHLEAHYNLANVYADVGNHNLAKVHYEVALRINPAFDSGYYNLAVMLMQEGNLKDAELRLMQFKTLADDSEKATAENLLQEIRKHITKRHQI